MSDTRTSDRKNGFQIYYIALFLSVLCLIGYLAVSGSSQSPVIMTPDSEKDFVEQYQRQSRIDTITTNTWQNITFDTIKDKETTEGYNLTDNNESIRVNFSGIVKVQGKITVINNATNSETQKIATRIVANGTENVCTQVSSNTERGSGNYNTIIITGTTRVESGDVINLQYQVDDTDLDISGDPVFEEPAAVSLNFDKISD